MACLYFEERRSSDASGGSISVSPEMEERATKELRPLETAARLAMLMYTERPNGTAVHGRLLPLVVALTTNIFDATIQRTGYMQKMPQQNGKCPFCGG